MKTRNRNLVAYVLAFVISMSHMSMVSAMTNYDDAEEPTAGEMLADTVLVRPPLILATLAGVGVFVVTLPFSALGGNVDEAGKTLVIEPAEYTFLRPLGDL